MQQYKFYFLNEGGHVFLAQDHLLPDDLSALESAKSLRERHAIEIWQSARQVARVEIGGDPSVPAERRSLLRHRAG